jgi:hypothetical protein
MPSGLEDRKYWVEMLYRISYPVLDALANRQLKASMPIEVAHPDERRHVTHLEAFGRTLAGLAPWLGASGLSGDEERRRAQMAQLAQQGLRAACDPASPDAMNFSVDRQPLVDAAFLVHGILRAPEVLWHPLDGETQRMVIDAVRQVRVIIPNFNNWLLFAAMVETFLYRFAGDCDLLRIDYALRQHEQWYLGDGVYGDGPHLHWDYYNSYVIQPMLLDIAREMRGVNPAWDALAGPFLARAQRCAVILERQVSPEGTFPVVGRSITYRVGAFQLLAQLAWKNLLPESLAPAQVRGVLTAVMRRTLDAGGTFDADGWLTLGLSGHQPSLAEPYISTGSLYLCTVGFLPLGLSPQHDFWSGAPRPWTAQRIWAGEDWPRDAARD